ncbi:type II toxin-antitoxin system antitoxin SocA domain-containing protein [Devosia sp. 66-22]|uniref:Panacea domain-containing protein n=1 Tax=Devosia sp. 66-22 TaxID=1895753 RepID=UPI0009296A33|nr:type II toxin-antitoxin system antitoxin SocA domain-containing protein [Devosia sp. 66-22]OJX55722.1 MAG: hypothetical protein BGO81_00005 [Devosia sp. 66-22]
MAYEPHDARAVANLILAKAKQRGKSLTLMQLIKLVYLCHGWSWAMLGRPMVKGSVQAWQYGPVYPEVYSAFKEFGSNPISAPARSRFSGAIYEEAFDNDENELIEAVLDAYGDLHAFQLSNMMHRPGTPWTNAYNANGAYSDIDEREIRQHYEALRDARASS